MRRAPGRPQLTKASPVTESCQLDASDDGLSRIPPRACSPFSARFEFRFRRPVDVSALSASPDPGKRNVW